MLKDTTHLKDTEKQIEKENTKYLKLNSKIVQIDSKIVNIDGLESKKEYLEKQKLQLKSDKKTQEDNLEDLKIEITKYEDEDQKFDKMSLITANTEQKLDSICKDIDYLLEKALTSLGW